MENELRELKQERFYDRKSINRHSCRIYEFERCFYMLDRTTDASPPFFTLYALWVTFEDNLTHKFGIDGNPIPVNGEEFWGDGITWKSAETLAATALTKL